MGTNNFNLLETQQKVTKGDLLYPMGKFSKFQLENTPIWLRVALAAKLWKSQPITALHYITFRFASFWIIYMFYPETFQTSTWKQSHRGKKNIGKPFWENQNTSRPHMVIHWQKTAPGSAKPVVSIKIPSSPASALGSLGCNKSQRDIFLEKPDLKICWPFAKVVWGPLKKSTSLMKQGWKNRNGCRSATKTGSEATHMKLRGCSRGLLKNFSSCHSRRSKKSLM